MSQITACPVVALDINASAAAGISAPPRAIIPRTVLSRQAAQAFLSSRPKNFAPASTSIVAVSS
jgi:hypothetical protein